MSIEVPVVNAFVANGTGGNPAGAVLDASNLSDEQMQYIAHEVGASETAFVLPDKSATHRVRFFTPTVEVPLCGHATIATWSYMFSHGKITPGDYTQATLAGLIHISVGSNGLIFMEQPEQQFEQILDFDIITSELGIPANWINSTFKAQIVQKALLLGFKSKQQLNDFKLDTPKLLALNKKYDFYGLHLFVMLDDPNTLAAVRDFDPIVGIDEDAATGTTNGSFLTYLKHYNTISGSETYMIEQGEAMGQFSNVYGKFQDGRVWIGGTAKEARQLRIDLP